MTGSIWIFGYGSLVHRPGFEHARRVQGYIPGFRRVWYQGSTDHRGTPERPGRVVTLEPNPGSITYGVAYELTGSEQQQLETLRYLEWREKQYDVRHLVDVYGDPSQDMYSVPPPVDISHLMPEAAAVATVATVAASSTSDASTATQANSALVSSTSAPVLTNNTSTQPPTDQSNMINSISSPAIATNHQQSTEPQPPALAMGTQSMSSFDPLMSSDEVQAFKPPDDWQKLRATEFVSRTRARGQADENGHGQDTKSAVSQGTPAHVAEGVALGPEGSVPSTRLLLRNVLCYIASSDIERNNNWLGPAPLDDVARQVVGAIGPSGPNWVYVVRLAAAMRQMGVEDPELFELESKVLELRKEITTTA